MPYRIVPLTLERANAFVREHHRHHGPVVGHKFSMGVVDDTDVLRGVAIIGRPVARLLDDGLTLEITRVATDGARNACSVLYGAARRAAIALGYRRLITYTLATETGASLRAVQFQPVTRVRGRAWSRPRRPRNDAQSTQDKVRWEAPMKTAAQLRLAL